MPIASNIYYHPFQEGDADTPPVVLIHGAGGSHLYWPPEIRRLPDQTIYALDLPGHGRSGGAGQQSIPAYADHVLEWLQSIGLSRAVFVGHSMGSGVALRLAICHPENVLGLGLVGGGGRLRVHPEILSDSAHPTTFHKAVETIVSHSFAGTANPRLLELASRRILETRQSVLHGDLLACNEFDVLEALANIAHPALVICGAEDKMTPLRFSQFLARSMQNARLAVIPQAGHMVMLEKPYAVADALLAFLEDLPRV